MYVIGIDPGPVVGVVRLHLLREPGRTVLMGSEPGGGVQVLQVTPGVLTAVLDALGDGSTALAYERFVVGPRAARSRSHNAGVSTRTAAETVGGWGAYAAFEVHARSAAEVKPWATDERLAAAGLLEATKGMRHARDAARHALFCAVRDFGLADPLSRKAGA